MPAVSGVAHLALSVRDLEVSEAWYSEVFGVSTVRREQRPHRDTVVLADPAFPLVLSLCHHFGGATARFDETRTGLDHVSFAVPDREALEAWAARLDELGIEHSAIAETPSGAVLVLRDPDHIQLEFSCAGPGR
jgi:catechol 2,3-dioxygenase-like lactoylglutathione lyase family enzyme